MSVLKNISKIYTGRPPIGRQALSVIFFFKFAMRSLEKKALSPPPGDRVMAPYISSTPPLPSSFEPENSTKNPEKKREVRTRKAAKPCRIQHL